MKTLTTTITCALLGLATLGLSSTNTSKNLPISFDKTTLSQESPFKWALDIREGGRFQSSQIVRPEWLSRLDTNFGANAGNLIESFGIREGGRYVTTTIEVSSLSKKMGRNLQSVVRKEAIREGG